MVANLRTLVAERAAAGAAKPVIKLVFVAMRRNVAELPGLVDLAADVGVDELWVQNLSHTFSDTDPAGRYSGIRAYTAEESLVADEDQVMAGHAFTTATAVAAKRGLELRLPKLTARQVGQDAVGCTWPWDSGYVTHRGEVQPCCMVMGSDRATLGRLDEQPFAEIWHGERYQRFRAGLLSHDPPEVCQGCSLYRSTF